MTHAPSPRSQVNHDTSIWRESDTGKWFLLIGGCTYNAPGSGRDPNIPSTGHTKCQGNAQLWTSPDLWNFTYVGPLTPGGPGGYWELPYLQKRVTGNVAARWISFSWHTWVKKLRLLENDRTERVD